MTGPLLTAQHEARARNTVVLVFASAALGVIVLFRQWPESRLWVPAALAGISIAIWHGAYDAVLGKRLWQQPRSAGGWLLPFVAAYVALAAVVVGAWFLFPVVALAAFLAYSGLHFGMETEAGAGSLQRVSAVAFGCLPIAAACCWQRGAVVTIFATMLRGEGAAAEGIAGAAAVLLLPCTLLALVPLLRSGPGAFRRLTLVAAELLLFRFCPPVLAFAVFFCLLHTPEHLVETSRNAAGAFCAERMGQNLRAGLLPWLLSIAAIAGAAWMGQRTVEADTALLFIALSALTVPHMALAMFLTASAHRNEQKPFRSTQRTAHP